MRNIKISFEHQNFIYPFKLSLSYPPNSEIDRINYKAS